MNTNQKWEIDMKTKSKDNIIEVDDYTLFTETDKAYGLWDGKSMNIRGGKKLVWVPKSITKFEDGVLQVPEWLATKSGLV